MPRQLLMMEPGDEFLTMDTENGMVKVWRVMGGGRITSVNPNAVEMPTDTRPHSPSCGIRTHPHGRFCAEDCPTCVIDSGRVIP